jgi:hypothetical protein
MAGPRGTLDWQETVPGARAPAMIGDNPGFGVATLAPRFDDASSWKKSSSVLLYGTGATARYGGNVGQFSTVYWPCVIRTDNIAAPLARYYMYYSTDHGSSSGTPSGGIAMAYADSPLGPWKNYGQVYVDPASQSGANLGETETPSVMWDPLSNEFRMFYQQIGAQWGAGNSNNAVGQQSTLSCTSTNGITWTKDPDFILDIPSLTAQHGDGHTGYFTPFETKNGLFAYSLYGGTNGADFVLWKNNGPLDVWTSDRVTLGYSIDLLQGTTIRHTGWNCSSVVESQGIEWWVGRLSNFASGANAADCIIGCAPISKNYRHLMRAPVTVWSPTLAWESSDMRCCQPFIDNNTAYYFYTIAKNYVGVTYHAL